MTTRKRAPFDHTGSSFDSFLAEEAILEEVEAAAIKRVIAWQLAEAMKTSRMSKKTMAALLDPENSAVHLQTIAKAARALGKRLRFEMVDAA